MGAIASIALIAGIGSIDQSYFFSNRTSITLALKL